MMNLSYILRSDLTIRVVPTMANVYLSLKLGVFIEAQWPWHVKITSREHHPYPTMLAIKELALLVGHCISWLIGIDTCDIKGWLLIDRIVLFIVLFTGHLLLFVLCPFRITWSLFTLLFDISTLCSSNRALTIRVIQGLAVIRVTLSLIASTPWWWLGVWVDLLRSDQERVGLIVDNCDLSSWHDELIDELIYWIASIVSEIKMVFHALGYPRHYLPWLNSHRELFKHLIEES